MATTPLGGHRPAWITRARVTSASHGSRWNHRVGEDGSHFRDPSATNTTPISSRPGRRVPGPARRRHRSRAGHGTGHRPRTAPVPMGPAERAPSGITTHRPVSACDSATTAPPRSDLRHEKVGAAIAGDEPAGSPLAPIRWRVPRLEVPQHSTMAVPRVERRPSDQHVSGGVFPEIVNLLVRPGTSRPLRAPIHRRGAKSPHPVVPTSPLRMTRTSTSEPPGSTPQ